jgi:cysteine desulfurase/selenocysteine lyase
VLENGTLDMAVYQQLLAENPVKLVNVMQVSNVLGTINPVKEMAQLAHEHVALILVDGAQSVPHMPVDVQDLDVDFFVFSSHKMAGPTGIGVLYGKRDILTDMPPYQGGGDMISRVTLEGSTWNDLPYKFEAGTPSIAEAIGLGAAIDYLSSIGMDKIHRYEQMLTEYALERLTEVTGVTIYGPQAGQKGAVAAFTLEGVHAHDVAQVLDSYGIAVRAGHHCAMPLHDFLCVKATARASFYFYNTYEDIDTLAVSLEKVKTTFVL